MFRCINDGVCDVYIDDLLIGEGMAYGDLPFRGIGCPVRDVDYMYLVLND